MQMCKSSSFNQSYNKVINKFKLNTSRSGRVAVFSLLCYYTSRPYTGGIMGFAVGGVACGGAPLGPPSLWLGPAWPPHGGCARVLVNSVI